MAINVNMIMLNKLIVESKITTLTNTKLTGVEDGRITVESNGVQSTLDCNTVVLAIKFRANNGLEEKLKGKVKDIVTVSE
jgi:NADH dehydrogenase FAD-containing subunit